MAPAKQWRERSYQIHGSIFDLKHQSRTRDGNRSILYKRYIVSPEFIQLWYDIVDDKFNDDLYDRLTETERNVLASSANWLKKDNRQLNVRTARTMRSIFDRFEVIEGAIKAGNLNQQLVDEYVDKMSLLRKLHAIPHVTATKQIKSMLRTYEAQLAANANV